MRKVLSPLALVIGVLLLVLGIGYQSWWAPSGLHKAESSTVDNPAPLTVIDPNLPGVSQEGTELTIRADGEFKVALGRSRDVDAWVGDAAHQKVEGLADGESHGAHIPVKKEEGKSPVPDPSDSDLWVDVQKAKNEMVYRFDPAIQGNEDWSLLLFVDGKKAAPTHFSTEYHAEPNRSGPVAMTLVGIVFVVLGIALLRSGPSRKIKDSARSGRAAAAAAMALSLAALPAIAPQAQAATGEDDAAEHYQLTPGQVERILNDTSEKVAAADKKQKVLPETKQRLDGAALKLREANYQARAKAKTLSALEPVGTRVRTYAGSTDGSFPRQLFVVTNYAKNDIPQLLFFQQRDARSNYQLLSATPMVPGSTLEPIDHQKIDAVDAQHPSDLKQAQSVFSQLAANLNDEKKFPELTKALKSNVYVQLVRQDQKKNREANEDAKITIKRSLLADSLRGIKLGDGSMLVTGVLESATVTKPNSDGSTLQLEKLTQQLAGAKEAAVSQPLTVNKYEQYTLLIPAQQGTVASAKGVQLIGVAEITRSARVGAIR